MNSQQNDVTDIFVKGLKDKAKILKKSLTLGHVKALDMASREAGFKEWAEVCRLRSERLQAIYDSGSATITFEDEGQDFLTWHIKDRVVVGCEPFQADVWCGVEVTTFPKAGSRIGVRLVHGPKLFIRHAVATVDPLQLGEGKTP
jgi:hypothetical protein